MVFVDGELYEPDEKPGGRQGADEDEERAAHAEETR